MNYMTLLLLFYLKFVMRNVGIEPILQPLSGKQFHYRSANVEDGVHLDVMYVYIVQRVFRVGIGG